MLAPESARALQSLLAVQTVSGDTEEALRTGLEAVRCNRFDMDSLADLGARLTQAERPREGRPLLLRAAEMYRVRLLHEFYLFF
jgi:Flp pilus assembly protein TadD